MYVYLITYYYHGGLSVKVGTYLTIYYCLWRSHCLEILILENTIVSCRPRLCFVSEWLFWVQTVLLKKNKNKNFCNPNSISSECNVYIIIYIDLTVAYLPRVSAYMYILFALCEDMPITYARKTWTYNLYYDQSLWPKKKENEKEIEK